MRSKKTNSNGDVMDIDDDIVDSDTELINSQPFLGFNEEDRGTAKLMGKKRGAQDNPPAQKNVKRAAPLSGQRVSGGNHQEKDDGADGFSEHRLQHRQETRFSGCLWCPERFGRRRWKETQGGGLSNTPEWVRFFSQFPHEFVVGGDFNAHHPFWGDAEVCAEGRGLFDAMVEGDLYCLNAGSPTRFATPHSRATTVDITLSNSASFLAAHWETVDESWGSNHYPIRIEIAEAIRERLRFTGTRRVHTAKTDWERVHVELNWCQGRETGAVFLDIKGAYDNVLWDILIEKLKRTLQFADVCFYTAGGNRRELLRQLEECIEAVAIWLEGLGLDLALQKTQFCIFEVKIRTLQNRALQTSMGYRKSTPLNVICAEACEPLFKDRATYLGICYIGRTLSDPEHALIPILERLQEFRDNPVNVLRRQVPLISIGFNGWTRYAHLVHPSSVPLHCHFPQHLETLAPSVSFEEGEILRRDACPSGLFGKLFPRSVNQTCMFTDGSKSDGLPFAGSVLESLSQCRNRRKNRNHLIWEILDEISNIEREGGQVQLYWIPAHMGISPNERVDREAKEAVFSGVDRLSRRLTMCFGSVLCLTKSVQPCLP
ncbi:hypothetical protein DMN91_001757 [Ooceraea biroi]|uniref:Endonuclease/exonuclease/phosphatase domain-containing protein n=1 Tax=Ooceraea biroi TaxID=2015173 RepID=A0A3L8DYQ5_OOCBI|nr:hypothetical protein DMN91_001757 [Ooceraea biroi]